MLNFNMKMSKEKQIFITENVSENVFIFGNVFGKSENLINDISLNFHIYHTLCANNVKYYTLSAHNYVRYTDILIIML